MATKFGERIRRLRAGQGLGFRAIAKFVGISLNYPSRIEINEGSGDA